MTTGVGQALARRSAAARAYHEAIRALDRLDITEAAAGITGETAAFTAANRAVAGAERGVPRWARELIDRLVCWELDYWCLLNAALVAAGHQAAECPACRPGRALAAGRCPACGWDAGDYAPALRRWPQ